MYMCIDHEGIWIWSVVASASVAVISGGSFGYYILGRFTRVG